MSKMGNELEKRLDENKYPVYEALHDLASCFRNIVELDNLRCIQDSEERHLLGIAVNNMTRVLSRIEKGGE